MDTLAIESLYKNYGFETKRKTSNYIVFLFSYGYFRNIEIVYDGDEKYINEIVKEYQQLRFPVNVVEYKSLEEIHISLFTGFFLLNSLPEKLEKKYKNFVNERNFIDDDYQYVPCSYYKNNRDEKNNLIDFLYNQITSECSSLTILEAAAGYGKTCTVFELMHKLSKTTNMKIVPLFVELSKNRNAPIFKYVLLDEIDRNFSTLSSELVISEIKEGRVPLIIDGFDELLSSVHDASSLDNEAVEKTQTMLETIIELFQDQSRAKIIITSRKTSLISSKVLDDLILELEDCPITRLTLREPTLEDWLPQEKINFLKSENIPIQQFSNPILLKFLQRTDIKLFNHDSFSMKKIIQDNFKALLNREITRQQLELNVAEQDNIFTNFAAFLIEYQISCEEPSFIFDAFKEIIGIKINDYLSRYTDVNTRPTETQFIGKLTRHALLDTDKAMNQQIGFANDYICGLFFAKAVIENKCKKDEIICKDHIDKICTAYKAMPISDRKFLFNKLKPFIQNFDDADLLQIDLQINEHLTKDYSCIQVENMIFENFDFLNSNSINETIFTNCIFRDCIIGDNISNCQFIGCSFYNPLYNDEDTFIYGSNNYFFNCFGVNIDYSKEFANSETDTNTLRKTILEQFWRPGRANYEKRKHQKSLFICFEKSQYKEVGNIIEDMRREKILLQHEYGYELNNNKIQEIRNILGR